MIKRVSILILLTIFLLAFSPKISGLSIVTELIFKISKGLVFIIIVGFMMRQEKLFSKKKLLNGISGQKLIKLIPLVILLFAYLSFSFYQDVNGVQVSTQIFVLNLLLSFIAASGEEVAMRGYLFNYLNKEGYTLSKSLVISSAIFSVLHFINIFKHGDIWSILNQVIFALALGMLLGSIFAYTKNLIIACIVHFIINVPSVFSTLQEDNVIKSTITNANFTDHLISALFFAVLMTPVFMLAYYYLKAAENISPTNRITVV